MGKFLGFLAALVTAVYSYTGTEMGKPSNSNAFATLIPSRSGIGRNVEPAKEHFDRYQGLLLPNHHPLLRIDFLDRSHRSSQLADASHREQALRQRERFAFRRGQYVCVVRKRVCTNNSVKVAGIKALPSM